MNTATVTVNTETEEFEYELEYLDDLNVVHDEIFRLQPKWTSAVIVILSRVTFPTQ